MPSAASRARFVRDERDVREGLQNAAAPGAAQRALTTRRGAASRGSLAAAEGPFPPAAALFSEDPYGT
jgi:hypothetical protein